MNPPPEAPLIQLCGILPQDGEWGWDPIRMWALPFRQDTPMGMLARYVWDTATQNSDGSPDFDFDIVFTDSQSPLAPDWKPNGAELKVRRWQKTDIYPPNIHPGQEQRLYQFNFQGPPHRDNACPC